MLLLLLLLLPLLCECLYLCVVVFGFQLITKWLECVSLFESLSLLFARTFRFVGEWRCMINNITICVYVSVRWLLLLLLLIYPYIFLWIACDCWCAHTLSTKHSACGAWWRDECDPSQYYSNQLHITHRCVRSNGFENVSTACIWCCDIVFSHKIHTIASTSQAKVNATFCGRCVMIYHKHWNKSIFTCGFSL